MSNPAIPDRHLAALRKLPAPNTHRENLPLPVQQTLTLATERLGKEVERLADQLSKLSPLAEAYAPISVRLSATLKDYLNISGADEAAKDMAAIKAAQISVDTHVEKQLRASELDNERKERDAAPKLPTHEDMIMPDEAEDPLDVSFE